MDNTAQKPFACKTEDCDMSFTNEDHLNVHEKKHEIQLNLSLENKSANVFVDQTPTPTRLIKNCEEVGLFDDLKHVNPFDETFRRAVESKQIDHHQHTSTDDNGTFNTTSANDCLIINEESLHTPQVFPNIVPTIGLCQREDFSITKQNLTLSETLLDHDKISSSEEKSEKKKNKGKSVNFKKRKLIYDNLSQNNDNSQKHNKQELPQIVPNVNLQNQITTKSVILPSTISIIQPQIITLKLPEAAILPSKPILLPKIAELENIFNPTQPQPILTIKEKLKNVLNNHNSTSQLSKKTKLIKDKYYPRKTKTDLSKTGNNNSNDNDESKNDDDSLERRRAAAMRYRKKIKREQADLKEKNAQLTAENAKLKATIKQLKQILAYHQNCDVTKSSVKEGLSNISHDPSQNLIKSTVQTPTEKFLVNVPKIAVQQNQHQQQSVLLITSDNFTKKS